MTYSPGGAGAGRIATASDAAMSGLANNHFLMYNATTGKWVNHAMTLSDFSGLDAYIDARIQASGGGSPTTKPGVPTGVTATPPSQTSITLTWAAPSSNGGSAITGYTASVTGGSSQTVGASTLSATFTGLTAGTTYTLSVAATNTNGTGTAATTSITLGGGSTGGNTGGSTNPRLAALVMPARGWFSGGAGAGIDGNDGSFGAWRGSPVDFISTWNDAANGQNWDQAWPEMNIGNLVGLADIAIGGPGTGDFGNALNGSLDAKLASMVSRLRTNRTINGVVQPTIFRPFHEFNNGYSWKVTSDNQAQQLGQICARWKNILINSYPEALLSLGCNGETTSMSQAVEKAWTAGNGCFDVLGADRYNHYPYITDDSGWNSVTSSNGDPKGLTQWLDYAGTKGVPLYLPEYANSIDKGPDNPYWVNKIFSVIKQRKGKGAGQFLGDSWFNINQSDNGIIYPNGGSQPTVANAYKAIFA